MRIFIVWPQQQQQQWQIKEKHIRPIDPGPVKLFVVLLVCYIFVYLRRKFSELKTSVQGEKVI